MTVYISKENQYKTPNQKIDKYWVIRNLGKKLYNNEYLNKSLNQAKDIWGKHQPHVLKAVYMHVTNALFMVEISNPFNSKTPHIFRAHAIVTNKKLQTQ